MHSSRMRTARLLPVSPSMHCSQGGSASGSGLEDSASGPGGSVSGLRGVPTSGAGGLPLVLEGCLPLVLGTCASQYALGQTPPPWTE